MTSPDAPLFTRNFALLLAATFGALSNYAPLLSVVPLWAAAGGAPDGWVGATTGVMMATTVLTQLAMPWLFPVLTLRRMLALGALLLGLSTPAYVVSNHVPAVIVVSGVRGVGFALVVVAGAALVAELVASARLGTGAGVYGVAAGLPSVLALPAGVWLADAWGFGLVFWGASALALLATPLALALPDGHGPAASVASPHDVGSRGWSAFLAPTAVFLGTAVGFGAAITFLPLAVADAGTVSLALLAMSACMVLGRLGAGAVGDRLRPGRLLLAAVAVSALGVAAVAAGTRDGGGVLVVVAAAVFGVGFGVAQNDSLVVTLQRAGAGGHGTASAVWNLAYDGGTGLGAVLLGLMVADVGYSWGFAVMAVVILATAPAAWRVGVGVTSTPRAGGARGPRRGPPPAGQTPRGLR